MIAQMVLLSNLIFSRMFVNQFSKMLNLILMRKPYSSRNNFLMKMRVLTARLMKEKILSTPTTETLPNNLTECSKDAVKTVASKDAVKKTSQTITSKSAVKTAKVKFTVKSNSTATSEHVVNTDAYKSKNRNGKVGFNKKNDYASVKNAPRKLCNNCDSSQHLTHVCKKPTGNKITAMSTCFNMPSLLKNAHI